MTISVWERVSPHIDKHKQTLSEALTFLHALELIVPPEERSSPQDTYLRESVRQLRSRIQEAQRRMVAVETVVSPPERT